MHESRCFRASRGKMGCISCHDPHELPDPEPEGRVLSRVAASLAMPRRGAVCRGPVDWRRAGMIAASIATCRVLQTSRSRTPPPRSTSFRRFADRAETVPEPRGQSSERDTPLIHFHRDRDSMPASGSDDFAAI